MEPDTRRIRIREDAAAAEAASVQIVEAAGVIAAAPQAATGRKWRVRVFEYGLSKNRYEVDGRKLPLLWTRESAEALLGHLDGAQAFANHPEPGAAHRSVRDLIGYYSNAGVGPKGPEADLEILESEDWAQKKMLAAWKLGRPMAFSIQSLIAGKVVRHGKETALEVTEYGPGLSVDLVSGASSGGTALEILEQQDPGGAQPSGEPGSAKRSTNEKGAKMKKQILKVLEQLRALANVGEAWLEKAAAIEADVKKEGADESALLVQASEAFTGAAAEVSERDGKVDGIDEQVEELRKQIAEAERKQKVAEAKHLLHTKIAESRLPATLQKLVRDDLHAQLDDEQYDPAKMTGAAIDQKIKRVREGYAPLAEKNKARVSGVPASAEVGLEESDKWRIGLQKLFGVTHEWKEVREGQMVRMVKGAPLDGSYPGFSGIKHAYGTITGDNDVSMLRDANPKLSVAEDWVASSFSNALGDSIRRALLQDFMEPDYGLDMLVPQSARANLPDFRTQERIRVGYFGDLPAVDPELADYAELDRPTDEKATYAAVQFGGLVTITRKMIKNDDLGIVLQIVSRLGRSARRTLARRVFNLLLNNPAIYDGTTWFHATLHGANLRTTALSATELGAIRAAMRNQTEKDSNEKIGIGPSILVVPHELEGTARTENMREFLDDQFTPNPVRFMFGQNGERIIVSPLLSDATDFYTFADQSRAGQPCIELGFIDGRQEPDIVIADAPNSEKVFTSDRIRWKIRHEYEAVVTDFRGSFRNTVAG